MPKRNDIKRIAILGSGPIVIGQACEFDYSGTQACKALMNEGFEVILINSNPATIMTDPEIATRVYIEPLTLDYVEKILEIEKPQALIPTLGGQTALNLGLELQKSGILSRLGIELLGAKAEVIETAEDREKFRAVLDTVGAKYPRSQMVRTFAQGEKLPEDLGLPLILRPNYTLGGGGGGIAYTTEEYEVMLSRALKESPTSEVLVEESILGYKEFELEVMRDEIGTFVIVCSIENVDPCGVHTGDSITVAPQQTLSDVEYQAMRDEAKKIVEAVGLETGGANVQFAVHPVSGERVVIEMNPRVSRSSALASKATGFPIAKIAALVAVGYHLHEIQNDITQKTPSCYEPSLDYIVTKIPRFNFEKFAGTPDLLTTQMKSVGEVMAIGRTFKESLGKALSALEFVSGFDAVELDEKLISYPNSQRLLHVAQAFRDGYSVDRIYALSQITPWFLEQIQEMIRMESEFIQSSEASKLDRECILRAKRFGFSDAHLCQLIDKSESEFFRLRESFGVWPGFYQVDTCSGEFESQTPYYYSTYWTSPMKLPIVTKPRVAVLGSGANRIGQGIEFDYCCVRGVKKLRALGYEVAMINSNPETVSTDYDTADLLFFEPLSIEHVSEVFRFSGVRRFIAQLGGQTPINLAHDLVARGFELLGSSLQTIDLCEDRKQFTEVCGALAIKSPQSGIAYHLEQAVNVAQSIGYPIMCRPSYVLGGRRMQVVENHEELISYFEKNSFFFSAQRPCLMDSFLEGALEIDVDIVRSAHSSFVAGIVEHIESAGVHSGDSMGVLPPQRLKIETEKSIEKISLQLADKLDVIGHLNLQLAVKNDEIYILEANPRSSRSVPFVAKSSGLQIVDHAIEAMVGLPFSKDCSVWRPASEIFVKGVVFPFKKFKDSDSILGPEMKSTGESMGIGHSYSEALIKALISSHIQLPTEGEVFLSLKEKDKSRLLPTIQNLVKLGYRISSTFGTSEFLKSQGIDCLPVKKVYEGRPNCVDRIRSGEVSLVINTTSGRKSIEDSFGIRRSCIDFSVPCVTESQAADALVTALEQLKNQSVRVSARNYMSRELEN